jgi:hypothetical protein
MTVKKRNDPFELAKELTENPSVENAKETAVAYVKLTLEQIFEIAQEQKQMLMPDQAMLKLASVISRAPKIKGEPLDPDSQHRSLAKFFNSRKFKRSDTLKYGVALTREAHHYAVDLYYRMNGYVEKGAPQVATEEITEILLLREQGLSYPKIARKIGLPFDTPGNQRKSADVVRKRIAAEKKRNDANAATTAPLPPTPSRKQNRK